MDEHVELPPVSNPLTEVEKERLRALNQWLCSVEAICCSESVVLAAVLQARVENDEDRLLGFEIEATLRAYLRTDDPEWREDGNNTLAERNFSGLQHQSECFCDGEDWSFDTDVHLRSFGPVCYLFHDLHRHNHQFQDSRLGRALGVEDLLRIGSLWLELRAIYQWELPILGPQARDQPKFPAPARNRHPSKAPILLMMGARAESAFNKLGGLVPSGWEIFHLGKGPSPAGLLNALVQSPLALLLVDPEAPPDGPILEGVLACLASHQALVMVLGTTSRHQEGGWPKNDHGLLDQLMGFDGYIVAVPGAFSGMDGSKFPEQLLGWMELLSQLDEAGRVAIRTMLPMGVPWRMAFCIGQAGGTMNELLRAPLRELSSQKISRQKALVLCSMNEAEVDLGEVHEVFQNLQVAFPKAEIHTHFVASPQNAPFPKAAVLVWP